MDIDVITSSFGREFKIINNNQVILKGSRPKWYSLETHFFFKSKSYQIKAKNFWGRKYNIFKSGLIVGELGSSWKNEYYISIVENGSEKIRYTMSRKKPRGWFRIESLYILNDNNGNCILSINYNWKKWKQIIKADVKESIYDNYDLLIYTLILISLKHRNESSVASAG